MDYVNDEDEGTPVGPITVRAYLPADERLEETRQKLEEALFYLGMIQPLPVPVFTPLADQNWMEAWKERYQPIPIGKKLIIVPAWLDSPDACAPLHQDRPRHGLWHRHTPFHAAVP